MTAAPRVIVVMPAYNAARTLERTYRDIPNLSLIHISEPTRPPSTSRMPSSA